MTLFKIKKNIHLQILYFSHLVTYMLFSSHFSFSFDFFFFLNYTLIGELRPNNTILYNMSIL